MRQVEPKVRLIGEPKVDMEALQDYLETLYRDLGVDEDVWSSDAPSDAELLPEFFGRVCYRSFSEELNPNLTKVRKGNRPYLANIIDVGHGSVLEHSVFNFLFTGVSRVLTHELVRHRAGTAFSQESMRFVRLTDIPFWFPDWAQEDDVLMERCLKVIDVLEEHQTWMSGHFGLNEEGVNFAEKKHKTSFMRRFAPEGVATTIGFSGNARAVRWLLSLRGPVWVEEELRMVTRMTGDIIVPRYPNLFGDYELIEDEKTGLEYYSSPNPKV